ncbi:hypothetical protein [Teredinibacter turnerae]|uniref:hypothetical protein n=1 Tax=Teredinibacter turnerae TaxID=2426 RepID=UPI0003806BC3|nr:hypothetical protein [Teredinibacter turnerae]
MLTEKEKKELQQKIQSNKHEVYVVSFDEMDAIIKSSPKGGKPSVKAAWQKIKSKVGAGASYYASADDAVTMTKLVADLGGIGARAYIKNYGGKPHIILKGHAGLRTILTGTKYGIKNPKVVSMGLGKAGAVTAAKQGGMLTVVLLSAYRVIDYFLTDQATLSQLIGTLATDVVKVGIATAASIGAAIVVAGMTTVAVGPIVAVILVGVGVSMLLEFADNKLGITDRVIAGLDELGADAEQYLDQKKREALNSAGKTVNRIIDQAVESAQTMAVNWVKRTLREYLSPSLGAR